MGRQGRRAQGSLTPGLWARGPGLIWTGRVGGKGIGRVRLVRGSGPGGAAVTHRAAATAAEALRTAPAIQLRHSAPPRLCPARPGRPAPGPEPPPACGHVTRDLSGTRRTERRGVVGSGGGRALPPRGHGGPGRLAHFRSGGPGTAGRVGRKWGPRGHTAQSGCAGRRRPPRGDREQLGGRACGSARRFLSREAVPAAAARGRALLPDCAVPGRGLGRRVAVALLL